MMLMKIEYDTDKNLKNIAKHGISLTDAAMFEWNSADFQKDERWDYGERRIIATGLLRGREYVLIFTMRGDVYRIISLRKANKKERAKYEKRTKK